MATPTTDPTQFNPSDIPIDLAKVKRDKELLTWLKSQFSTMQQLRVSIEQQWYLNLAFYRGKQWSQWVGARLNNNSTLQLVEPSAPRWRVRLTANKIKPVIRNEFTKLTKEEPQWYCYPQSTEETDIAAARAAESVNEFLVDLVKYNARRRSATLWACMTGNGFLKTYYDEKKNIPGNELPGAPCLVSVSPFHVFVPDLQCEDIEDEPHVTHASARPVDYVKDTYGVDVSADSVVSSGMVEQRYKNIVGIKQNVPTNNTVFVRETWIKPCGRFPNGNLVVWIDTQLIYESGMWPYAHGQYPFAKIDHVPTPGSFYSQSVIDDLIPLQKEYNKTRSQIIESKNRMGKPQLISQKGAIDPKKVTSEPGLIIEYQAGFAPPTPLALQPIPGYVIQEIDRTQKDMDDVAGQYEITQGRTPPGVEAASAIAYLQEENDTRMYHTVASIEEATEKVGKQMLSLVQQFWDEERIVKVVSKNGAFEAMLFKGSNLNGNVDIRIEGQSMAPRSRAARQAFITELMNMGVIPPDKGLRYLGMAETNTLFEEMQVSVRQAQRENMKMAQAQPVNMEPQFDMATGQMTQPEQPVGPDGMPVAIAPLPINDYDDGPVHIAEHEQYCRTQEFELLPPDNQTLILNHLADHKAHEAEIAKQAQMEQMQMQQPGEPNAGGTGPRRSVSANGSTAAAGNN